MSQRVSRFVAVWAVASVSLFLSLALFPGLFPGLFPALFPSPAFADTLEGKVVGVADGDTVTVLDSRNRAERIRLLGIDAPEKNQVFGTRAKQRLSDLVFHKHVTVYWSKRDRYGRVVGKVVVPNPACPGDRPSTNCHSELDAGFEQVRSGLAWHYKQFQREQLPVDRQLYARAEDGARHVGLGVWSDPRAVAPNEFRRLQRSQRSLRRGTKKRADESAPFLLHAMRPRR